MSQPTKAMVHLDQPLTNISIAYTQDAKNFIAGRVFPNVPVEKQSDKYFVFDRNTFMRDQMRKRGSGEESAGSGYTLSNESYYCDLWALHKDISWIDRANTDNPLSQDRGAVTMISQAALIRKEKEFVDTYFKAGVWGTDTTVGAQWSDYASSDPIGDVDAGKETILEGTGAEANKLILSLKTFNRLKNHPDIRDMIKYTSARVVTEDVLAGVFGVEEVLVAKSVLDSTSEGKAAAPAFMYGKHALLLHVAKSPGLEVPSAGYCFSWKGLAPGFDGQGVAMEKFELAHLKSDRIEGHTAFDMKVTGAPLAVFFGDVVA